MPKEDREVESIHGGFADKDNRFLCVVMTDGEVFKRFVESERKDGLLEEIKNVFKGLVGKKGDGWKKVQDEDIKSSCSEFVEKKSKKIKAKQSKKK